MDAAAAARTPADSATAMERLSPAARKALKGGVLILRALKVSSSLVGRGAGPVCAAGGSVATCSRLC